MATPAITSSIFQEIQSFNQNRRTDLQQLSDALQSGNLDAAKQAFSALQSLGQSGPNRNGEPFSNTNRAQDFEAIGQALQSGDIAEAQAAFATLQSTFATRNSGTPAAQGTGQGSPAVVVNIGSGQNTNTTGGTTELESIYQQLLAYRETRKSDIAQLGAALQSSNVTAAQQAYNALVTLGASGPNSNSQVFQRADRAQAFAAIGTALQNGDLAGAQQAFATLANSFQQSQQQPAPVPTTPGPVVNPSLTTPEIVINLGGANGQTANATPEVVINIASGNNSGTNNPEEIQINFGGSNDNSSGGQITIDLNQPQSGSTNEPVAISVSQQNNEYKVVLDLLNANANSPAQTSSLSLHA